MVGWRMLREGRPSAAAAAAASSVTTSMSTGVLPDGATLLTTAVSKATGRGSKWQHQDALSPLGGLLSLRRGLSLRNGLRRGLSKLSEPSTRRKTPLSQQSHHNHKKTKT